MISSARSAFQNSQTKSATNSTWLNLFFDAWRLSKEIEEAHAQSDTESGTERLNVVKRTPID